MVTAGSVLTGFAGGAWQEVQLCAADHPWPAGGIGGAGPGGAGGAGGAGGPGGGSGGSGGTFGVLPHLTSSGLHGTAPLYVLHCTRAQALAHGTR